MGKRWLSTQPTREFPKTSPLPIKIKNDERRYLGRGPQKPLRFYDKYQPNQTYDPETFLDPDGYLDAIEALEIVYIKQVNVELKQKNDQ